MLTKEVKKAWKLANKEKVQKSGKKYYEKNKERILSKQREYRLNNKEKIKIKNRTYAKKKAATELGKLEKNIRARIRDAFKSDKYKPGSSIKDLGCTLVELKEHLEMQFQDGMTWDNYGKNGWEIDHIIPLSAFDLTDKEQFLKVCHYTNLQPLWMKENRKKSSKIMDLNDIKEIYEKQIESLTKQNEKLYQQIDSLQQALFSVKSPLAYKDMVADRSVNPAEEINAERAAKNKQIFNLHTKFVQMQEEPLFKDPDELESILEGVLFKNIKPPSSLHQNNES